MAIRFKCPHCQKSLSVKDQFAGKKGTCPACKKGLTIPALETAPAAVDVEALAAAAFTDAPAAAEANRPREKVNFTCPFCDAAVEVGANLAGKQAPCPECRRIVKVPQLVKDEPVDWRKPGAARGPSGARRDVEPAPEGAWDSSLQTKRVSQEALMEAGLIVEEREPWSLRQKILLGGGAAAALLLLGGGLWLGLSLRSQSVQNQAIEQALGAVSTGADKPKLGAERDAAIHLAAGEFYLRSGKRDCVGKARERFTTARSLLPRSDSVDRDLLLIEIALAQLEMGSADQDEIEKERRLKWLDVQKEVMQTLSKIHSPEIRAEGVRAASRKLIEHGQNASVGALASNVGGPNAAEALALAGMELLAAGDRKRAEDQATAALENHQQPPSSQAQDNDDRDPFDPNQAAKEKPAPKAEAPKRQDAPPALVALGTALGIKEIVALRAEAPEGYAEGLARRGDLEAARREANAITRPTYRLRALVGIAAVSKAPADLEAAVAQLEGPGRGDVPAGLLRRLLRLGLECEQPALVDRAAKAVSHADLKAWAQLEAVRGRLAGSKDRADDALADAVGKERLAHALALQAVARHNARVDGGVPASVSGWDEKLQPFGRAGAALGMQDRSR